MTKALDIECPRCEARAGVWCTDNTFFGPRQPVLMHPGRYSAASAARNEN